MSQLSDYKRFHIETSIARSRKKEKISKFIPEVNKTRYKLSKIAEALKYNVKLVKKEYRQLLKSTPCIYGVYYRDPLNPQTHLCMGSMRCIQERPDIYSVSRNVSNYPIKDEYWLPPSEMNWYSNPLLSILSESERGKIMIKGMGYKGSLPGYNPWDEMWTDMSEIVRPTRDGIYGREYISTKVSIGRKPMFLDLKKGHLNSHSNIVELSLPVFFDYLPPTLKNQNIIESIAEAAKILQIFYIDDPTDKYSKDIQHNEHLVPLINSKNVSNIDEIVKNAKIVEIEVDRQEMDLTGFKERHPDIVMIERIALKPGIEDLIAEKGKIFDGFHFYADFHGREFGTTGDNPRFIRDILHEIHKKLVKAKIRDTISIIASGGIIIAEHVPKAIIMGADAIAINTSLLISLESWFKGSGEWIENCIIDPNDTFDSSWGTKRLINLMGAWHHQMLEVLSAMGIRDIRRLRGEIGRALFRKHLVEESFNDIKRI